MKIRRRYQDFLLRTLLLGGVLCCGSAPTFAQDSAPLEYRVKAAFLFYFVNFVEWPEETFLNEEAPVKLCVIGEDPFGPVLDQVVDKKQVRGRPLIIMRGQNLDQLKGCHLLFISQSEQQRLRRILQGIEGKHVLTVYESPELIRLGGAIGFVLDDRKVRFEINLRSTNNAGLTVSSKLLKVARHVVMP